MIKYTSQYQTKITEFSTINHINLNPDNRWMILAGFLRDELVKIYKKRFSTTMGAKSIDPRQIIGAFIIKHKLCLTDEETLLTISENPYMQFFLGLDHYQPAPLFSPTLFVEMRKKLGDQTFDEFSTTIMSVAHPAIDQEKRKGGAKETKPKGKLKIDATVADQTLRGLNDDYGVERDNALKNIYLHVLPASEFINWMKMQGKEGAQNKFPRVLKGDKANEWKVYVEENSLLS